MLRVSRLALLTQRRALGLIVDADLDTLATALYVRVDDFAEQLSRAGANGFCRGLFGRLVWSRLAGQHSGC